jgi:uncharacterized membrane protein
MRLYGLDAQSLWADEGFSWRLARAETVANCLELARADVHPPGYFLLLRAWTSVAGDSEVALRIPSAVAGVLAVVVLYLLGARLFSKREGLVAAALLTPLWCGVYYSQEARPYVFLLLLTEVAALAWLSCMADVEHGRPSRRRALLGWWVAAAALCWVHYFGMAMVLLLALAAAWLAPRTRVGARAIALLVVPVLLLCLPWSPAMVETIGRGSNWIVQPLPWSSLSWLHWLAGESWLVTGSAGLFLLLSLPSLWRARPARLGRSDRLLVGWLIAAWAGALAFSWLVLPVFTRRNMLICLPPALLLASRLLLAAPVPARLRLPPGAWGAAVPVLLALHLLFSSGHYTAPHKEQIREAASFVETDLEDSDLVVAAGSGWATRYYLGRVDIGVGSRPPGDEQQVAALLAEARQRSSRMIWIISGRHGFPEVLGSQMTVHLPEVHRRQFHGAEARAYRVAGGI